MAFHTLMEGWLMQVLLWGNGRFPLDSRDEEWLDRSQMSSGVPFLRAVMVAIGALTQDELVRDRRLAFGCACMLSSLKGPANLFLLVAGQWRSCR